jgi:hypothetical protein
MLHNASIYDHTESTTIMSGPVLPSAEFLQGDIGRGFETENHIYTLDLEMLEREPVEPAGRGLAGSRRERPHGLEVCVWH